MKWYIRVNEPWFTEIKNGKKRFEGRCCWNQNARMQVWDQLEIANAQNLDEIITVLIIGIHRFRNFQEALESLPLKEILPGVKNVDDGIEIYKKFVSLKSQTEFGVVMIEIS